MSERIKARLSDKYLRELDYSQQQTARRWIRNLVRDCTDGCCGGSSYVEVGRHSGITLESGGTFTTSLENGNVPSVGEAICQAVAAGFLPRYPGEVKPNIEPPKVEIKAEPKTATLQDRLNELRKHCERSDSSDVISTRTHHFAAEMVRAGLPDEAILHAATLSWSESDRQAVNVKPYDPATFGKREKGKHALFSYVKALADRRIPIMLIGPAGTGKGYLAGQIADSFGVERESVPLTGGASPAWLTGRQTPAGYVPSSFVRCYRDGGVFLFDEIDAADPNMLIIVNEALANGQFDNPITGERIPKSPDFVPMAAGNTHGTGADANYVGRARLDYATLDRFRLGRVEMKYDTQIEDGIWGDLAKESL